MRAFRHTALLIALLALTACGGRPTPIAAMKNPTTGAVVTMYREDPLKVPAGYNEDAHIQQWKAEQKAKGFTVEEPVR